MSQDSQAAPQSTRESATESPAESPPARAHQFDRHMIEALVCPVTHAPLGYDATRQELISKSAGLAFPIRDGIPIMLVSEARQLKAD